MCTLNELYMGMIFETSRKDRIYTLCTDNPSKNSSTLGSMGKYFYWRDKQSITSTFSRFIFSKLKFLCSRK